MLNKDNLYRYQKRAINTVCMQKKIALFLDMGLGKTAISLYSIWWLKKQGMISRTLIISPKSVCEVWKQEVIKWQELKDLSISIVAGDANARLKALNTDSDIYCIGRDNVRWMAALKDKDNGYLKECNMLVVDESTSFKHRSSLRWKSLCQKGKRNPFGLVFEQKSITILVDYSPRQLDLFHIRPFRIVFVHKCIFNIDTFWCSLTYNMCLYDIQPNRFSCIPHLYGNHKIFIIR